MANIPVVNALGSAVYLKSANAGTDVSPHVPSHIVDSITAALPAGTNNVGDIDVLSLVGDDADLDSGAGADPHALVAIGLPAAGGHVVGGTGANPIRTDPTASTAQPVTGTVNLGAGVVGSFWQANPLATVNVTGTLYAVVNTVAVGSAFSYVEGLAPHDGVPTGNPLAIGARAQDTLDAGFVVNKNDISWILADLVGAIVTRPHATPENGVQGSLKASGAVTAQGVVAAAGASIRNYVTDWQVTNPNASLGTDVCLHDGTTTLALGHAAALGGFAFQFPVPRRPAQNATISVIAATASVPLLANVGGYKGW